MSGQPVGGKSHILVLGSFPFFILLMFQQDSALLLLFVTLALRAFQKNEDSFAGAYLAMALFRFPIVVPLIALLCLRRPRLWKGAIPVILILGIHLHCASGTSWLGLGLRGIFAANGAGFLNAGQRSLSD